MATIDVPLSPTTAAPTAAQGETMSFEALYERQFRPMVRLAYTLVDTRQQAEEVVQDSFAAVYERFHRLDNPEAYLRVTVLNGCRRVLRRRVLSRRQPIPPSEDGVLGASHVVDAIPIGTVKSTIHRALAELRRELS